MGPIAALFSFAIRQTLVNRKIWLTVLMLAAPCILVLVIRSVAPPIREAKSLWEMYHVLAHVLLVWVLVPLVCMMHGTALIGAEAEAGTIVHLITRRLRRSTVLLVKFVATALALAALCGLAMVALHVCALAGRNVAGLVANSRYADWSPTHDLCCYLLMIPVAVVSFLAIFNLIGLLTRRPLAFSVVYLFTVELIVSNIPAQVAVYSLSYQLRVTLARLVPRVLDLYELPRELREQLYPPSATAWPELAAIVLVALVLSGVLVSVRELMPAKVARE